MSQTVTSRPASATNFFLNALALVAGVAVLVAIAGGAGVLDPYLAYLPLAPCAVVMIVIAAAEWWLRRSRRLPRSPISARPVRPLDLRRVALRLFGFCATIALIACAYWLFPEYSGSFYAPYWRFLKSLSYLAILLPLYFFWVDRRVDAAADEFVAFGMLLLGRGRERLPGTIRRHLLGWTVKAFFLPLMTVYLNDELNTLARLSHPSALSAFATYDGWFHLAYTVDLLFCVIGYTAASRLFDSHIRSVEPTMLGWVAALICYQPFYSVIGHYYLQYEGNYFWDNWLQPWPLLRGLWAAAIITLVVSYSLCTVAFGLRFSNLTHRGIITGGPYRFTKHPAYLSKNLSWWLISVPFVVVDDAPQALRHCALLLLLNTVYFIRARTEERHLSADPTYVAYARHINERGMLRKLGTALPWLRYDEPRTEPAVIQAAAARPR